MLQSNKSILALILIVIFISETQASQLGSLPVNTGLLNSTAKDSPTSEAVFTHLNFIADLKYDSFQNGYKGQIIIEQQIWLRTREAVSNYGRVSISSSQTRFLESVQVEVRTRSGRLKKTYQKDDLEWVDHSRASQGIVLLDTEQQHAAVPSLRVDDVLYFRQVYEVEGLQGVPVITLGNSEVPVLESNYTLLLPANYELRYSLTGDTEGVKRTETNQSVTWQLHWTREKPRDEAVVVPQVISIGGVQPLGAFVIGDSWGAVAANYRKLIEDRWLPDREISALAAGLVAHCESDSQRITVLYDYLQENTRYLGLFEGLDGIIPETAALVHKRCYGDCKGLGVYLVALLQSAGIEAELALVRTAGQGPLDESLPNLNQFNHVIVWAAVGQDGMWLDATVDHCPAGMIVPQDTASKVLLLSPGQEGLKSIPAATWLPGVISYSVDGILTENAVLEFGVTMHSSGIGAVRQKYISEGPAGDLESAMERALKPRTLGTRILEYSVNETDEGQQWICRISSLSPLPRTKVSVFLPMLLPPLKSYRNIEKIQNETDRKEKWNLILPEGWVVDDDEQELNGGLVHWHRVIRQENNILHLERSITWHSEKKELTGLEDVLREIISRESGFITVNIH